MLRVDGPEIELSQDRPYIVRSSAWKRGSRDIK